MMEHRVLEKEKPKTITGSVGNPIVKAVLTHENWSNSLRSIRDLPGFSEEKQLKLRAKK